MAQARLRRDDRHFADLADGPEFRSGDAPRRRRSVAEWESRAQFLCDLSARPSADPKGNWAKIDADGSTVTVQPETIVQFEGDELILDHGSLQLNTSRGMKVRVNCITVIPLTQDWNRYDVTDVDGRVMVAAHQNDVKIHYQGAATRLSKQARSSDVTVHQGEQVTREERCVRRLGRPRALWPRWIPLGPLELGPSRPV